MGAALLLAAGLLLSTPDGLREAVVTPAVENMYSAPDEGVDVVSQATLGQVVEVLATSGAFARVRTPDRYEGPGDLVFFGQDPGNITHVGLYVGDGRFIDATTHETPLVREDRLDDPHWSSIYQGARRPR